MTPKAKAQELYDKYYFICQEFTEKIQCSVQAKQCTLIAIEDIIEALEVNQWQNRNVIEYWQEVKQEIINL